MESAMPEDRKTLRYQVLRYAPNLIRDEWVNIGILLEEFQELEALGGSLRAIKVIEEDREFARVRKLHPSADVELLHGLASEFETLRSMTGEDMRKYFTRLESTLSNTLQLSPQKAVLAEDFNTELARLYDTHVAPPARTVGGGIVESTRAWIRNKLKDVFQRHRISGKLKPAVLSTNIPTSAIRLNLTTVIGMASAGTFSPWFSTAMRHRPRFWLIPLKA